MENNYEWLDLIPQGWVNIARKMIQECEAIDPTYTIMDMKEKWGHLDVYSYTQLDEDCFAHPESIHNIEQRYWDISAKTCCRCGAPATKMSKGWVLPFCDNCYKTG